MIADVSLRLLYLILDRFLSRLVLLGRTSSATDVELLVLLGVHVQRRVAQLPVDVVLVYSPDRLAASTPTRRC